MIWPEFYWPEQSVKITAVLVILAGIVKIYAEMGYRFCSLLYKTHRKKCNKIEIYLQN